MTLAAALCCGFFIPEHWLFYGAVFIIVYRTGLLILHEFTDNRSL